MKIFLPIVLGLVSFSVSLAEDSQEESELGLTGEKLVELIEEASDGEVKIEGSVVEFSLRGIPLFCIYDENHDRMRIISPIKAYEEVTAEEKDEMLAANYHGALDARYAESKGVLYSAFMHPLSTLRKVDVVSAIFQVASLHVTFGEEYSSGLLQFAKEEAGESV